ncbi:hypothetical protein F4804DRAFT_326717 [Jackrogersella minutella]|nr:hypothetical protein F4804DRAFT_326717 [Jackrogersella minutella]
MLKLKFLPGILAFALDLVISTFHWDISTSFTMDASRGYRGSKLSSHHIYGKIAVPPRQQLSRKKHLRPSLLYN